MSQYKCFVEQDSDLTPVSCDENNYYTFSQYYVQICMLFILIVFCVLIRPIVLYLHKYCCLKNEIQQEIPFVQEKEIQCDMDITHQIIIHPDQSLNLVEAL